VTRTKTKIALARIAYRGIAGARKVFGLGPEVVARRGGLNWKLDLREGIDLAIFLLGAFERATVAACRRHLRPGNIALDIGANIGAHTLHLAQFVGSNGRVFAFEPTTFAHRKLLANIALNPDLAPRIRAEQIMLVEAGARKLEPRLYSSWPLASEEDVHAQHRGRLMSTTGARAMSLDEYLESARVPSVALIKLDVDGYECAVLRGAANTIARLRPRLVMEIAPYVLREAGHELSDLLEIISSFGYALKNQTTGARLPIDAAGLRALIPEGAGVNVVAEPQ
jgi:FkbM family methyltransferase